MTSGGHREVQLLGSRQSLFQCRPFLGNDQLKNVPALAPLEWTTGGKDGDTLSLEEKI